MNTKRLANRRNQLHSLSSRSTQCEPLEFRRLFSTYIINGTPAADSWTLQADAGQITLNGTTVVQANITDVQVNGLDSGDILVVAHASIPVVFNGGNGDDQLALSTAGQASAQITSTVTFNGGANTDTATAFDHTLSVDNTYTFGGNSVNWSVGAMAWDSAVENATLYTAIGTETIPVNSLTYPVNITVNGNTGSDSLSVNMNGSTGTLGFAGGGGAGVDSLNITDNAIGPITYTVTGALVSRGGRTIQYASVESLALTGTPASSDTFNVSGGGASPSVSLTGGNASDTFNITGAQFDNIAVDGGAGPVDSLVIDDRTHPLNIPQADADVSTFTRYRGAVPDPSAVYNLTYTGMEAWTYFGKNSTTAINVYGTPSSLLAGQQATIICGSGNDTVTIHPHDANGNLTINGNLGVGGGLGSDKVFIDDAGSTNGINYLFTNTFGAGTQNVYGLGTRGFGAGSDVETIEIHAGDGEDTFVLNTWESGAALIVAGGDGYDTFDISPTAHSLPAAITNMSYFSYNGQGGEDHFDVINYDNTLAWNISRTSGAVAYSSQTTSYFVILNIAKIGYLYASGGTQNDQFFIYSTPADNMNNDLYGAAGNDTYTFGDGSLTSGIASYVNVDGYGGTDSIVIDDSADTVGRSFHMDDSFINPIPGDTLFPAAGGDIYGAISLDNVSGTVTLKLGSGADTIYAAPNSIATFIIQGNNPTTTPGDSLTLAFAAATNPLFFPQGTGNGTYTFSNRQPLKYTGIESVAIDNVAPVLLDGQYNYDPASGSLPSVNLRYSESVEAGLYNTYFDAYNLTLGHNFGYGTWTYRYDSGTNTVQYTFPALSGGVLPDGNYTAYTSRVTDQAGNRMNPYQATFDFFVLTADANRDRSVDTIDFNILAANFGKSDKTFGQGDFNYDGSVDTVDFNLLAGKFGQTLAAPAASMPAALPVDPLPPGVFSRAQVDSAKDSLESLV